MVSTSLQNECVDKILRSEEFAGSTTYKSYLTYLVDAKTAGKSLKETTIAIEFFGKSSDFNPAEDAIVRSHTYTLRKKLETHYLKEGREDKCRLKIPKGHYEVIFASVSKEDKTVKNLFTHFVKNRIYILIISLLLITIALLFIKNRSLQDNLENFYIIDKDNPIWRDYLQSTIPILIAIGDHFFFTMDSNIYQNLLAIRDGKINSLEDLENIKSNFSDKNLRQADEPYFPYHSIWSLPPVLSIFYFANQKPILRKSSSLSSQILDEYNIIYLGSIKSLYILKYTLLKSHFRFSIAPHRIEYLAADTDSIQYFNTTLHSEGPNEDLVLALKLPGPLNNSIFIIASYHSLGAPEISNYLMNPSTRFDLEKKFQEKFGYIPHYFELLFRVTGIDKTAYNTELLIYEEILKED